MRLLITTFTLIIITCFFTSCEGEQGPAGEGLDFKDNGFIQLTINGTRADNTTPINEEINFSQYPNYAGLIEEDGNGELEFNFLRFLDQSSLFIPNQVSVRIGYDNNTKTVTDASISGDIMRDLSNGLIFGFDFDARTIDEETTITFNNFTYDESASKIAGSFTLLVPKAENSSENPATIVGSFETDLVRIVNKK